MTVGNGVNLTIHPSAHALPLAGASLVVTRPAASAVALKRRIAALGGVALGVPGVGLRLCEDAAAARAALREAGAADLIVFVSPAAVRCAWTLLPDWHLPRSVRVCAIGAASARALARRGVPAAIRPPARQDSEGLLALPELAHLHGRRIALIGAPGGRDLLPGALRERGADVQRIEVYRRVAPRLTRRHFLEIERAPAPLLTLLSSAEILTHLQNLLPAPLFARLAAGEAIVSSQRLAVLAHAAGFARVSLARSANAADLLDAAVAALARYRL